MDISSLVFRNDLYHFLYLINKHCAGLPSLVPIPGSLGPASSNEYPLGANIHNRSHLKINSQIVAIISLSAVVLVLMCIAIGIIWRYKGFERSHANGHISNSSFTRKGGNFLDC
jgi:hypothetical protein